MKSRRLVALLLLFVCVSAHASITKVVWTHPVMVALERVAAESRGTYKGAYAGTAVENASNVTLTIRDDINPQTVEAAINNGATCEQAATVMCAWGDGGGTSYGTPVGSQIKTWKGPGGRFCAAACSLGNFAFVVLVQ